MTRRKRKNIIIVSLICIFCLMAVGYSAFLTKLDIKGTTNISSEWSIKIISVSVINTNGMAESVKSTYTDLTANLEANLYNKGDYAEYKILVENSGDFDAKLDTLGITNSNNEAVKITASGFTKGQTLYKKTTKELIVKIAYNSNYEGDAGGTSGESDITLGFTQNEGGTITPTKDHLVTYDYVTNGGESTTAENEYLAEGSDINLSYTASKKNYEFLGWSQNASSTTPITDLKMGSEDITLYAIFKSLVQVKTPTITTNEVTKETPPLIATNDDYPWTNTDGVWKSSNKGVSSSDLSFKFTLASAQTLSFDWSVSSYSSSYTYVYYTITKDGTTLSDTGTSTKIGGTSYGTTEDTLTYNSVTKELEAGDYIVTFTYNKTLSNSSGTDTAYVKNFNIEGTTNKIIIASIEYPGGCGSGVVCSYKLNDNDFVETSSSKNIDVLEDTIITAKSSDENEEKTTIKKIDYTPPALSISTTTSTKSITIAATAVDKISDITKYEYSKDGGTTWETGTSNSYTFNGLTQAKSYSIAVRVTNSSNLSTTLKKSVTTSALNKPTYTKTKTSTGAIVTIKYPSGCGSTLTCSYVKDGGAETSVTSTSQTVVFTAEGTLIGKVSDGINTVSSTYNFVVTKTYQDLVTNINSVDGLYKIYSKYYYRGTNPSNYIYINLVSSSRASASTGTSVSTGASTQSMSGLYRIISIENGVMKIIKNTTDIAITAQWDTAGNRNSSTDTYCTAASIKGCDAWVATKNLLNRPSAFIQYYPNGNTSDDTKFSGAVTTDSALYKKLVNFYYSVLSKNSSIFTSGIFNVSTPGYNTDRESIYTNMEQEAQYQVASYVGLYTVSELMNASDVAGINVCGILASSRNCYKNNWLWPTASSEFTLSPSGVNRGVWMVSGNTLTLTSPTTQANVRPVFALSPKVEFTGSGTESDPYRVIS